MPVDLELILSASPPLYAYSAFVDGRYTQFTSGSFQSSEAYDHGYTVTKKNYINSRRLQTGLDRSYSSDEDDAKRELSSSSIDQSTECEKNDTEDIHPGNKPREKKKVSFADDKGLALVEVRNIPGSPSLAPKWARDFFSALTDAIKPKPSNEKKWKIAFPNPPYQSDAISRKTEKNLVALQSVVVAEGDEDVVSGTIIVKNIAYEKEVFVRVTYDRWSTYEDIVATYDQNDSESVDMNGLAYDTFKFSATIKPSALRYEVVEFCICFRTKGQENWDNNEGVNYRLVCTAAGKAYKTSREVSQILSNSHERSSKMYSSVPSRFSACSELDTWKTLLNDQPYW